MPLPSSGEIKMSQIKAELGSSSNSLRAYAAAFDAIYGGTVFDAPDTMSEFYGYSATVTAVDFTYTAGGSYKNEGTLLVTSATGGVGTKRWYLNNGSGGTFTGPYDINTNTQTGLANTTYTMKVEDSAPTPNFKIYQYAFSLPRRVGPNFNRLYYYFRTDGGMTTPTPTSVGQFTYADNVEASPSADGSSQDTIWTTSTKYNHSPGSSGPAVVTGWVGFLASDGTFYYKQAAWLPNDNTIDTDFDIAYRLTIRSISGGYGTVLSAPPPPPATRYTFIRYNVDANCDDSNATEVWSFTNYSNGFYTIGGTLYRLLVSSHTNYTTEITTVTASSCTPPSTGCECYTIYNEGETSGQYRYNRCSDGALVTGNIARNSVQTICVINGGTVEIVSGTLTDVPCGTPCSVNGDCSTC